MQFYQEQFRTRLGTELRHIIIWTDNAPTQYRCRQNFLKIGSIEERHPGVTIVHRLAVVENFKGYHDSVGKDPAQLVRALELVGIRSPNAYSVFENVWFVVETEADQERLSVKYPGRILLCDRSFVLDTHAKKAVDDTTRLHEFRSTAMRVADQHPITWQAGSSRLPCNCPRCLQNPNNSLCHVSPWRKPQTVTMQIACPPPLNNTWSVDIGESLTVHLPYFDLCKWKKRFENIADICWACTQLIMSMPVPPLPASLDRHVMARSA